MIEEPRPVEAIERGLIGARSETNARLDAGQRFYFAHRTAETATPNGR